MKNTTFILSILLVWVFAQGCNGKKDQNETEATEETTEEVSASAIKLTPYYDSPGYDDAMIALNSPEEGAMIDQNTVSFDFNVTNYELATQTADADIKMCANSAKGQHIHLILNNQPYSAHYEASFDKDLDDGHYVALAFLSRSYHESVKNPDAYVLRQFTVGEASGEPADLTQPHMFYSRPKGTYSGDDTKKVILDFYLANLDLSPEGYKVRATINGEEFMITEWSPQFIEGLPMGQSTIKLELLDAEGNLVNSPFNPVERSITLEEGEQPA